MISKEFKDRILGVSSKDILKGTFVKMNCPDAVEILGLMGIDFIIIDGEHAPCDELSLSTLLRAADAVNLPAIVRVPVADEFHILKALDMGAAGVQLPGISSVEEAKNIVKATKYAPMGSRGLSFSQRSARFGTIDKFDYMKFSNDNGVCVMHIENKYMAEHVEELCQIEGVDVLFVGPMDLSQSYGVPGNPANEQVQEAIHLIAETAAKYGKQLGIFVGGTNAIEKYAAMGFRYFAVASDQSFLIAGIKNAIS